MAAYGALVDLPKPLLVAAGGIAGATLRWATVEVIDSSLWSLVVVNSAGAFVLGLVISRSAAGDRARLAVGIGFCGALTTFSTLALAIADRLEGGEPGAAAAFAAIAIGIAMAAALSGARVGRSLAGPES